MDFTPPGSDVDFTPPGSSDNNEGSVAILAIFPLNLANLDYHLTGKFAI